VEGGARSAHLRRLQPGQPRPHDGRRLQPARSAVGDRRDAHHLGGAGRRRRPGRVHRAHRAATTRRGGRSVGGTAGEPRTHRCAARGGARPRSGPGELPFRPSSPRCRASRRVQPSRAKKD
jgi:hypothetical protein